MAAGAIARLAKKTPESRRIHPEPGNTPNGIVVRNFGRALRKAKQEIELNRENEQYACNRDLLRRKFDAKGFERFRAFTYVARKCLQKIVEL